MGDEIKKAISVMSQAMQNDLDYAWTWHCNIAMPIFDEGVDHATANRASARIMKALFEVDIEKHEFYKCTQGMK